MMDVFQSKQALIRSAQTLAQSVSALPITSPDCWDVVPTRGTAGDAFEDH